MKVLFHIQERVHGAGRVRFEWNQRGTFLASCGANGERHPRKQRASAQPRAEPRLAKRPSRASLAAVVAKLAWLDGRARQGCIACPAMRWSGGADNCPP